jgi:hypothetical protein
MKRKEVEIFKAEVSGKVIEFKECTKCGRIKSLSDYYDRRNGKGDKHAECMDCMKAAQSERRRKAAAREIENNIDKFNDMLLEAFKQETEQRNAAEQRIKAILAERCELIFKGSKYDYIKEVIEEWAQE